MSHYNSNNNISLAILIQYHQMGFKLVPLGDDGKIPNVSGLLNPEARQKSIEESKNGKEEPVNYVYNHPEFWNEERIKKEAYRFKNVATALGKTHLKRDDGSPLYINALDIDSEQVFTTLSRLSDHNGNDFYFIDEACKSTFVSKTKKKYGRHIFWLSSEQHKSIGTRDCKLGTEFEIKTDNSLALITLPPSRHRDDLETHYQSIGANKIEILDRMYDLLLETLKDCLKPKDKKNTNYHTNENFGHAAQVNLNDGEIDFIYQLVIPHYRTGYRHHILYGLSGLLHKHNITRESAASLIQKLSIDDEERESRLLTLNDTYQKNQKEVSGYQYLLLVLENVVADGEYQAKEILKKILNVISVGAYNEDTIVNLTTKLMTEFSFKTMRDNEEIYYYHNDVGVYLGFGDSIIREYVEVLHPNIKTYQVNEIVQKIKRRTYVNRDPI